MSASYDYYWQRLRGEPAIAHVDDPQPGFYRNNRGEPVAFFPDPGTTGIPSPDAPIIGVQVRKGEQRQLSREQAMDEWKWCCAWPVEERHWRAAAAGEEWPDEAPGLGHNRPPEAYQTPAQRAERVVTLIREWLDANEKVETQDQADQAAHYITEARAVAGDLVEQQKREIKPMNDFIGQIKTKFENLRAPLVRGMDDLKARLKPYLDEIDRRKAEERRRADEERRAHEARAAQLRAEGLPPPRVPHEAIAPSTRVGGRGKAVTLRSVYTAEIIDYEQALAACRDTPDVRDAVQKIANARAREAGSKRDASLLLPGTNLKTERRV
jgi:hypothetical protein